MSRKKKGQPIIKAENWEGNWQSFLEGYKVYPALTEKLDSPDLSFTQESINEIVLWKLGRYAEIPTDVLDQLNDLRVLPVGEHEKGEAILKALLSINGVRLPMASTFLRFANPKVFQIIDRHLWRAVYGTKCPNFSKKPDECSQVYFPYLADLHTLCGKIQIKFSDADRILFEFDKRENPPLSENH